MAASNESKRALAEVTSLKSYSRLHRFSFIAATFFTSIFMALALFYHLCDTAMAQKLLNGFARLTSFTSILGPGSPVFYNTDGHCHNIPVPSIPGIEVFSVSSAVLPQPHASSLSICQFNVSFTHKGENDNVTVEVWFPQNKNDWNGRFLATGGGGYSVGETFALEGPVQQGYAAARTDGGHELGNHNDPSSWALREDGSIDETALTNFAHRSIHDMAAVGKAVTTGFYLEAPKWNYFRGCSTGGRQGYRSVQQHPEDFDGVLAMAPAINWGELLVTDFWGQAVMHEEGAVRECIYEAFQKKAVELCDDIDGVKDGVIGDVEGCMKVFDLWSLAGKKVDCGKEGEITVTDADALVIKKIHEGPKSSKTGKNLWYGYPSGANLLTMSGSKTVNRTVLASPQPIPMNWIKYFLKQDPKYDVSSIGYSEFEGFFAESIKRYNNIMGSKNPNISAFRDKGARLLSWHGLADDMIPVEGTVDYRKRVEAQMGGNAAVNDFYRYFEAPGVGHCQGGSGPAPIDPLGALVDWVEKDKAPDTLLAKKKTVGDTVWERNLCLWPLVARYDKVGDPTKASSYACAEDYDTGPKIPEDE